MFNLFYTLKAGWTNCYLLKCSGGYLLIDTGFAQFYPQLLAGLERLRISPSEIKYLLLTHHHDDHTGFAAKLVEVTRARLILHQEAVAPLAAGVFEFPGRLKPVNRLVEWVFKTHSLIARRDFHFQPLMLTDRDMVLSFGNPELLNTLGIDGTILYTPGHTSDSLTVLLSNGNAFVGDLATNFINPLGAQYRPPFFEDMRAALQGWRKLTKLGVKQVYPSHGNAFPMDELTHRIGILEERLNGGEQ